MIALAAIAAFGEHDRTSVIERTSAGSGLNAAAIYAAANPGTVDITAHTTTNAPGPFGIPEKAQAVTVARFPISSWR